MDLEKVIKALSDIKTYCNASSLKELDFAVQVLEKLKADGVKKPLETDFTKVAQGGDAK